MRWGERDVRAAYKLAADEMRRRRRTGIPIPGWLHEHNRRLELETAILSASGQELDESDSGKAELQKPEWFTVDQTAARVHLSERHVRRLAEAGTLPAKRLGRDWMFDPAMVDRWVSERSA